MNKKNIFTILAAITVLFLVQDKGIMPIIYKIVQSDFLLSDTDDQGSREAVSTPMTEQAFRQCNDYIKTELGDKFSVSFSAAPINSWGLGNYEYLINAEINLTEQNNQPKTERYACRIKFEKESDSTDTNNKDNWSILGVSGIDEL